MKHIYIIPEALCVYLDEYDVLTASTDFTALGVADNDYKNGDHLVWG